MRRLGNRRSTMTATVAILAATTALTTTSASASSRHAATTPGVTAQSITVGSLITRTGFAAADFGAELDGVNAYLKMVNSQGGVNGRTIVMRYALDDASSPSADTQLVHQLVNQDHVFAVVGVGTVFFSGLPYLVSTKTPTFGYATEDDWSPAPNLFAAYGSYINFASASAPVAYAVKQAKATKVGIVAYNVAQSAKECSALSSGLKKLKLTVAYTNTSVPFLGQMSPFATKMKQEGVNYVISCMDEGGDLSLVRALQNVGLSSVHTLWFDGYDRVALQHYPSVYANAQFLVQHLPFEAAAAFPGKFPGLETYLTAMAAANKSSTYSESAMEGWLSAALFVGGLQRAGRNLTQAGLINAVNSITNFTGGGLTTPVNWQLAHRKDTPPACEAFVGVSGSSFKLLYNRSTNPWICFPLSGSIDLTKPVAPPPGSPGA